MELRSVLQITVLEQRTEEGQSSLRYRSGAEVWALSQLTSASISGAGSLPCVGTALLSSTVLRRSSHGLHIAWPGELSSIAWATLDQVGLWGAASHLGDLKVWPGCYSMGTLPLVVLTSLRSYLKRKSQALPKHRSKAVF